MMLQESKLAVFEKVIPYLEKGLANPVPQLVAVTIKRDSIEQKVSLPAIIARRINLEGLGLAEHFEKILELPRGFLEGEEPLTRFSMLYSMASGHIRDVEDFIRGTDVVEEATGEVIKQQYIRSDEPFISTYAAGLHIILATLAQDMKEDPTGIRLVDRIAYGTPIPNSPLTILHQHPPVVRIIQIGADRYKNLYRAVSTQSSP